MSSGSRAALRHPGPALGHDGHLDHRDAHRRAAGGRGRPVPHPVRTEAAARGRPPRRSTCSRPCRRSSTASGGCTIVGPVLARRSSSSCPTTFGWIPFFDDAGVSAKSTLAFAGARPGHHGAADHHRHLARGLRPDARRPQGGRAGAGRDALGDDPHRGAAVRPARRHQRRDARPRPRAGRDHRRRHPARRPELDGRLVAGRSSTAARPSRRGSPATRSEFDSPQKTGAYIAAGLVLFVLTFVVNAIARIVIERRKAFTE